MADLTSASPALPQADGQASGQDLSGLFRGTGEVQALKDPKSGRGIAVTSIPAFVAGEELADLAEADDRIVVLTADLAHANRTIDFAVRHPGRFFNVGVAEQNMMSIAAGMASAGLIPFVGTFASYAALLACEQVRTDCAYTGMPVRILAHHSGMSLGFYGTSHHSLEDLGIMRAIAELAVVCAADANQLRAILRASLGYGGPMYIRLGRGRDPQVYAEPPADFQIGRAIRLREGSDLAIIATGSEVHACLGAARGLAAAGISVRVIDMHTIHPLDRNEIVAAARETAAVLTVEEHNITGGLGSAVAETLADAGLATKFTRHGVPDEHVVLGPPAALYAHYRLDEAGIESVARQLLER
ncbi:MAG TPA: transketolase C-terminal domain-containing protein [Streptosporangiaceae bacterium]|nr:transketolase C-terminal domain-containing protein [Streptosporangiaceae bacterium]